MNEISANECYVSFVRKGEEAEELNQVVANFSGVPREITTGVPYEGKYKEILNTDAVQYGGTGVVNDRVKRAEDVEWDDKKQSVTVKMAPLSLSILQFIPYTEAELEKVIEKRIRKNTPIRKTADELDAAYDDIQAAYDAYEALNAEQQAQITGADFEALLGWFNSQTALLADAQSGEHTHCVCGKDSGTTVIPITTAQHGRQPIPCLILRAAII